jgi:hypothetical protein
MKKTSATKVVNRSVGRSFTLWSNLNMATNATPPIIDWRSFSARTAPAGQSKTSVGEAFNPEIEL